MSDDPRWDDDPRDRRDESVHQRDDDNAPHVGRGPGSAGPRDEQSQKVAGFEVSINGRFWVSTEEPRTP